MAGARTAAWTLKGLTSVYAMLDSDSLMTENDVKIKVQLICLKRRASS